MHTLTNRVTLVSNSRLLEASIRRQAIPVIS